MEWCAERVNEEMLRRAVAVLTVCACLRATRRLLALTFRRICRLGDILIVFVFMSPARTGLLDVF